MSQRRSTLLWALLVLLVTLLGSLDGLRQALSSPWIVQDDARQHVFWMQRWLEPDLFVGDWIADYFQAVAPLGYTGLYRLAQALGLEPLLFNKLLPPLLSLLSAFGCFRLFVLLLPVPWVAALGSGMFVQQSLWLRDDVFSATPRAFFYALFLPFLVCLAQKRLGLAVGLVVAQALFYPHGALISLAVLALRLWPGQAGRAPIRAGLALGAALLLVGVILWLAKADTDRFGPVVTEAQARLMPEFLPGGRSVFFARDWGRYWFGGGRSGLLFDFRPPLLALGLLLPGLWLVRRRWPQRFPRLAQMTPVSRLLVQVLLASLGLFGLSHAVLFRLHLPARYTVYTLPLVLAAAAAVVIFVLCGELGRWQPLGVAVLLAVSLGLSPYELNTKYKVGTVPEIYQFLRTTPAATLVASLTDEANFLPTFAGRPVLTALEYAVPYHLGYYRLLRQRTLDLITAQYSPDPAVLRHFLEHYGVGYLLVEDEAFTPDYLRRDRWRNQYQPAAAEAAARLAAGGPSSRVQALVGRCAVRRQGSLTLLSADCLSSEGSEG